MSVDRLFPMIDKISRQQEAYQNEVADRFEKTNSCIRAVANTPIVKNHNHNININDKNVLWTFVGLVAMIVGLLTTLIIERQPDYDRIDNDLKYRYIKMKGEATPRMISELEDIFELNRDNAQIEQIREDVETYEEAVLKQAALAEQARLNEQAAKEQETKAKSIKEKQNEKSPQSNKSKP